MAQEEDLETGTSGEVVLSAPEERVILTISRIPHSGIEGKVIQTLVVVVDMMLAVQEMEGWL